MKNKILYTAIAVIFSFCFMNYSIAQETDLNTMINQTSMPSDQEIMETIKKYNFDKAQEEYLFKETKRKLNELYSNKNSSSILQGESTLNQNLDLQKTDEQLKTETSNSKNKSSRRKKHSSHQPLTRSKTNSD